MKRTVIFIILLFAVILVPVEAGERLPNNKVGISLLQPTPDDIKAAARMVNGGGGDWGYATLVIQENDRNKVKWQGLLDELREARLIPIIRLATRPEGEVWRRPTPEEAGGWAEFLNSLNWVVKERYVVLFNEPNHASEWGGETDPEGYGKVALAFAKRLKEVNADFFIMLAGFDASAPSYPTQYEDEGVFLRRIVNDELFRYVDAWASHSYPNPAFSGKPWDAGRKTITGYRWELALLAELGVTKELPVFITETGWDDRNLDRETMARNYVFAFENVWLSDARVRAVTPFVFDYQSSPFLGFSWKKQGTNEYYPQYEAVLRMEKEAGRPEIREKGQLGIDLFSDLVADSSYRFTLILRNAGQAIWDKEDGYKLALSIDGDIPFEYMFSDIKRVKPQEETDLTLFVKTGKTAGLHTARISLMKNGDAVATGAQWQFEIVPLPAIRVSVSLFPKLISSGDGFELQIFDDKEGIVYKKGGLALKNGVIDADSIQNIVLGKKYRIVILRPYYLPRQTYVVFKRENNIAQFKNMYPLDFNRDGKFGGDDLWAAITKPGLLLKLLP